MKTINKINVKGTEYAVGGTIQVPFSAIAEGETNLILPTIFEAYKELFMGNPDYNKLSEPIMVDSIPFPFEAGHYHLTPDKKAEGTTLYLLNNIELTEYASGIVDDDYTDVLVINVKDITYQIDVIGQVAKGENGYVIMLDFSNHGKNLSPNAFETDFYRKDVDGANNACPSMFQTYFNALLSNNKEALNNPIEIDNDFPKAAGHWFFEANNGDEWEGDTVYWFNEITLTKFADSEAGTSFFVRLHVTNNKYVNGIVSYVKDEDKFILQADFSNLSLEYESDKPPYKKVECKFIGYSFTDSGLKVAIPEFFHMVFALGTKNENFNAMEYTVNNESDIPFLLEGTTIFSPSEYVTYQTDGLGGNRIEMLVENYASDSVKEYAGKLRLTKDKEVYVYVSKQTNGKWIVSIDLPTA